MLGMVVSMLDVNIYKGPVVMLGMVACMLDVNIYKGPLVTLGMVVSILETLGGGGALSHFLLTKLQYILKGLVGIK
jgi:hypothetical protein